MRLIIFLFCCTTVFGSKILNAQEVGYFGLEFGASIPRGDFASIDINSTSAGFASNGFFMGLVGIYQFRI